MKISLVIFGLITAAANLFASGLNEASLKELEKYLFTRTSNEVERKGVRTDGYVVYLHGELAYERYFDSGNYSANAKHVSWSAGKSITNALIGIAIHEGLLSLDTRVSVLLPYVKNSALKVRNLLEMSSCLDWHETYEGSNLTKSSVLALLYGPGRTDMARFVGENRKFECTPGTRWNYSSGDTILLSAVLRAVYKEKYATMPWDKLFHPLGMETAVWERDKSGNFVTSSYLYASPRDFAKFGQLFLQDGMWNGRRILPEGWVNYSTQPARAYTLKNQKENGSVYGAQWWLNSGSKTSGFTISFPSAPRDMYYAVGHWGQYIVVIPSLDVVIVRTGDDRDITLDINRVIQLTLKTLNIEFTGTPAPKIAKSRSQPSTEGSRSESQFLGIPGLATTFQAKELCSCLYVSNRPLSVCANYIIQSPDLARYSVDFKNKTVHSLFRYAKIGNSGLYPRHASPGKEIYGCSLID